jgi:hypothetical protein
MFAFLNGLRRSLTVDRPRVGWVQVVLAALNSHQPPLELSSQAQTVPGGDARLPFTAEPSSQVIRARYLGRRPETTPTR